MRKISLIALISLTGCNGYHYIAPPHYIPTNIQRGQLTLSGTAINGLQAGYAITSSLSVFTSGYYRNRVGSRFLAKENAGTIFFSDFTKRIDGGLAYSRQINNKISVGLLSGFSKGQIKYSREIDLNSEYKYGFEGKSISLYLQPSVTIKFSEYFDISAFICNSYNKYYNLRQHLIPGEIDGVDQYDESMYSYLSNHSIANLNFIEPGLQVQAGSKSVKFFVQYSYLLKQNRNLFAKRENNIYMGISLLLDFHNE